MTTGLSAFSARAAWAKCGSWRRLRGGRIAAKILAASEAEDPEARKRFLREAELAMGVRHPNLVETYDVGEDPETGLCYILMEYVPGGSLGQRIAKSGPIPAREALAIVYQIATVLELAWKRGIVHRDIKPDNIMFGADGQAKLADLGIARLRFGTETTTVTKTGAMIGTPAYMAPEQMLDSHAVDCRADIYSLGVVLYEMLAGTRPNKGDTIMQLMAKAMQGVPLPDVRTLRPEVSATIAGLISVMCAVRADERLSTPGEVTAVIAKIVHGHPVVFTKKRPQVPREPPREKFRFGRIAIPIVLLALAAAAFGAWFAFGRSARRAGIRQRSRVVPQAVPRVETNAPARAVQPPLPPQKAVTSVPVASETVGSEPPRQGRVAVAGGYRWRYDLERDGAVLRCRQNYWRDKTLPGAIEPSPEGSLTVPDRLDGHPVVRIEWGTFPHCARLTSVILPDSVRNLGDFAFFDCPRLKSVRLPKNPALEFRRPFLNCPELEELDLGSCRGVKGGVLVQCRRFARFRCEADNPAICADDRGVLFDKARTTLLRWPPAVPFASLPATVTRFGSNCLSDLDIFEFAVPQGVRQITGDAFSDSFGLRNLRFPESLRVLNTDALSRLPNLRGILFDGDAPEFVGDPNRLFSGCPQSVVIYVRRNSKGWRADGQPGLPGTWPEGMPRSRAIRYREEGAEQAAAAAAEKPAVPKPGRPLSLSLGKGVTLELVSCPAGAFMMGWYCGKPHHAPHGVRISRPFWAGKYLVTRAQWNRFMKSKPMSERERALGGKDGSDAALPGATREEIDDFCRQLTRKFRRQIPKGYVFRLPTAAENEYMWRAGGAVMEGPFGQPEGLAPSVREKLGLGNDGKRRLLEKAGCAPSEEDWKIPGKRPVAEVGLGLANPWGLFDLSGNADQWLLDTFPAEVLGTDRAWVRKADSLNWEPSSVDPLFWCDEANCAQLLLLGHDCRAWGPSFMPDKMYARHGASWGIVSFRVVVGPDLVRESADERAKRKPAHRRAPRRGA